MNDIATERGFSPEDWPNLEFTDSGREQLQRVSSFLEDLRHEHPDAVEEVRNELLSRLSYLNSYGGPMGEHDPRSRFKVRLGRDFAPLSFTLAWLQLHPTTGEYSFAWNGGLIWHGGSNDPLCVSLTPQLWGIHT